MSNPKIIALLAFRDEEKYLPGYFRHLERYVDGFICIDDGSLDNSFNIAHRHPKTMRSYMNCDSGHTLHSKEVKNRKTLLEAAKELGADWVLCTDADERYEKRFLEDLRELTDGPFNQIVQYVQVRDLWNSPNSYRVDGIWSTKTKPVLFPLATYEPDYCDSSILHSTWIGGNCWLPSRHHQLRSIDPYNLYHLRSIHAEDRAKRVAKFNRIDPEKKFQAIGYDYLNDESGLQLEQIPEGRGYED